ncbi:37S ribosomal protein [Mycena kentingensis (nom. inval.)]|nr:37S ribosomal protein [Mycena kentingensis (nom. inval.)]
MSDPSTPTKRPHPKDVSESPPQKKPRPQYDQSVLPQVPSPSKTWDSSLLPTLIGSFGATKLEQSEDILAQRHIHYQQSWGRSADFPFKDNVVATGPKTFTDTNCGSIPRIFVFNEYRYLLERCAPYFRRHDYVGLLIMGTPGIGKTTLLSLWLFLSILQGQPILWYQDNVLLLHCAAGVYTIRDHRAVSSLALSDIVLLVNLDTEIPRIIESLSANGTNLRIVAASSPDPARHHHWTKQVGHIYRAVLDPPSWDEVKQYYETGCARFYEPGFEKVQNFDLYHQLANGIFYDGFNLRDMEKFVAEGWENAGLRVVNSIRITLEGIEPRVLLNMLKSGTAPGGTNATSESLVAVYRGPVNGTHGEIMLYAPRSILIYRALHARFVLATEEDLRLFRVQFRRLRECAATVGYAFEAEAHLLLTQPTFTFTTAAGKVLEVLVVPPPAKRIPSSTWDSTMEPDNLQRQVYYIPMSVNDPTFNSFVIVNGKLYAFQMSSRPTVSSKGIDLLTKCFDGPRYLVFVVPSDIKIFTWPQSVSGFEYGKMSVEYVRSENPANEVLEAVKSYPLIVPLVNPDHLSFVRQQQLLHSPPPTTPRIDGRQPVLRSEIDALRSVDHVERYEGRAIWTKVRTKLGATQVILRPRPVGFGLRCNPNIHRLCTAAGIRDISAKVWGSRNKLPVLKATLRLLQAGNAPHGMGNGLGGPGPRMRKGMDLRNTD